MTKSAAVKLPPVANRFHPALPVYFAFVRDNPELGLAASHSSWSHFNRRHGETLRRALILCRAQNGVPLLDPERFPEAAYRLLTIGTLPLEFESANTPSTAA